jgi:hypothetical protein
VTQLLTDHKKQGCSHLCVPKCVLGLENRPDVVAVPNPLELILDFRFLMKCVLLH